MRYIGKIEHDYYLKEHDVKIVVFGAGGMVNVILEQLKREGLWNKLVCICDNTPQNCAEFIKGIRVVGFGQACHGYKDSEFVVYNKYATEMAEQLIDKDITNIHYIRI